MLNLIPIKVDFEVTVFSICMAFCLFYFSFYFRIIETMDSLQWLFSSNRARKREKEGQAKSILN